MANTQALLPLTKLTKFLFVLACLSGSVAVYGLITIASLVINDISAGALSEVSETGWGFMIALFVYGPVFLVSGALTLVLIFLYRSKSHHSVLPILGIFVITGLIGTGILSLIGAHQMGTFNANVKISDDLFGVQMAVDKYAGDNNNALPVNNPSQDPIDKSITYNVIDQQSQTYEVCATFSSDTTKSYNQQTAQKISAGKIVNEHEDGQIFFSHTAGKQCYKLRRDQF